jgi:hypothetical protein
MYSQNCSLETAVLRSPVYTSVNLAMGLRVTICLYFYFLQFAVNLVDTSVHQLLCCLIGKNL